MYQLYRDQPLIILCIICVNIVLSLWCIYFDPIINNDAVTYLAVAQKLVDGAWDQAFTYYNWPFYSVLIACVTKVLSIDVNASAYIVNTCFAILLSLAFVCITRELSDNNRTIIIIATLVILFFPSINKYRSFIIRDFGYLACYLWSLYYLVKYTKSLNKHYLIGWLTCTALSCLFRFEGVVFLLIVPYFLLILNTSKFPNKKALITILSIIIAILFVLVIAWYLNSKYNGLIMYAKESGHNVNGLTDLFFETINDNLNGKSLTIYNYIFILLGNLGDVGYQLLRRLSVLNFILVIYAYKNRLGIKSLLLKRMWLLYIAINLIILASFSSYNQFIVSRYTLATSLTLLILVPFSIARLLQWAKSSNNAKVITGLLILLLTVESIDKLNIKNKKYQIKDAGQWLSQNLKRDEKIFSNNKLIVYYADQGTDTNLNNLYNLDMLIENLNTKKIQTYEYVAYSTISSFTVDSMVTNRLEKEYGGMATILSGYGEQRIYIYQRK